MTDSPSNAPTKTEEAGGGATIRAWIAGSNIDDKSLLATDYLNHFNEITMLLEMLHEMPDCIEEVAAWKPKSYCQHFADSGLSDGCLAVLAYDFADPRLKASLEETIAEVDRRLLAMIAAVTPLCVEGGDTAAIEPLVGGELAEVRCLLDRANGIIHGNVQALEQDEIDRLLDS